MADQIATIDKAVVELKDEGQKEIINSSGDNEAVWAACLIIIVFYERGVFFVR